MFILKLEGPFQNISLHINYYYLIGILDIITLCKQIIIDKKVWFLKKWNIKNIIMTIIKHLQRNQILVLDVLYS